MPSSDYSNAVGGGLKLKGAGGGGVDKKKKKKKAKKPTEEGENEKEQEIREEIRQEENGEGKSTALQKALAEEEKTTGKDSDAAAETEVREYGKTEAQGRFEERRKKRLDERLKKEGVQTHKERVQQLNKYLSTLSEHNDMPRIGPG